MKRFAVPILLGSLLVVLSSCAIVELPDPSFHFDSNWQRTQSGAFVFCSNRTTDMRYSFRVPTGATITRVTERYTGEATGRVLVLDRPVSHLTRDHDRYFFVGRIHLGEGLVPQNLQPEVGTLSIVVSPFPPHIPPSVVGRTTVQVRVTTTTGSSWGFYTFDVLANCP